MPLIKNVDITIPKVKDSHNRRALQSKNSIISSLRQLGLTENDVEIELIPVALKREPASVSWWIDGHHLYFSYKGYSYAENIAVIAKVLSIKVAQILSEEHSIRDFILEFTEEPEVEDERKAAREYLGVDEHTSLYDITKKYKELAKKAHPDMEGGDIQRFKELNRAHKILKRELE